MNGTGAREFRFKPGQSGNPATKWQKGQSGNPSGRSKLQRQFEEALADALAGEDPCEQAKELAQLVWAAARKGEAWAVQLLFQRLAPEPIKVEVSRGREDEVIDWRRLSDEQIEQLERIIRSIAPAGLVGNGEGPAPAA